MKRFALNCTQLAIYSIFVRNTRIDRQANFIEIANTTKLADTQLYPIYVRSWK